MELTILMPCLNEAETLASCIAKANLFIKEKNVNGEVLIADNGSVDGSQRIAADLGARVVDVPQRGYGAALIHGILNAKGKYVIMGDSDDSYDFSSIGQYLECLREGYDLVMGNRFKGGIQKGAMPFLHKYFGNPVLSMAGRIFFGTPIKDFHCGLRGFKQDIVARLHLQTLGMEFASEMVVKASLFKLKITEVPTTLAKDGRSRPPHLRTWRDGWKHLRFLLMHSPKWLFYVPGLTLFFGGTILMLLTLFRPFEIANGVYFDTNTLLYASVFVILGFSCVSLGLFTRTYATEEGFLPKGNIDNKVEKLFRLETGILLGAVIFIVGFFGSLYALDIWKKANFGRLDYPRILRVVVPSTTLILLGVQIMFSSFFLGILRIKRKVHLSK